MNEPEDIAAELVAAAVAWTQDQLQAERDRARAALLAEGMPAHQVQQVIRIGEEMHASQVALAERTVSVALGQASIH